MTDTEVADTLHLSGGPESHRYLLHRIGEDVFNVHEKYSTTDWRRYVPSTMRDVWGSLPLSVRMGAFTVAEYIADNVERPF